MLKREKIDFVNANRFDSATLIIEQISSKTIDNTKRN